MPERDDRPAERRRPAAPAWATVPTTSWERVVPQPREDVERTVPISPGVGPAPPVPRKAERPAPAVPPRPPARQILGPPGLPPLVLRPDLADALTAPTPPGGVPEQPVAGASPAPAQELPPSDPEQILSNWTWSFDPDTLREVADDPERLREVREMLADRLDGQTNDAVRARLLSLRAVVSRILGDQQQALADGKLALAHAEATGELRRVAITQARLAHVLQWQGEYEEADRLFALANSTELPDRLRATMHQHAGRSAYDQGRYMEACNHFEKALELRKTEDPELIAQTELALDAVFRKVAAGGWGPYPRSREEILRIRKPPEPAHDEQSGLWGFADEDGETCIAARYVDVQPFRDGVAWVQRPGYRSWELIDETGEALIRTRSGYTAVSSFSDGLAWVCRNESGAWIAVDKTDTVAIPAGFEDVRPFRRGMAAVRRGGRWGAVDAAGRVVVPFRYDAFATAMSDGRYIDGFSDEGLAVVELNGRKGVVDRTGRVLVEPAHPALVIHPVAFLIMDVAHRWGALDRHGRAIIRPSHPSRMAVTEEIDRLLADTRPML